MELIELKALFKLKTQQFEQSMESKRPHLELLRLYKEIKQIAYEITLKENEVNLIPG
jgi:hypothetical protein